MAGRVKVRVLACPQCGGQLRWRADVPIIECRYCHAHVVVETGRTTHLPAQAISRAPARGVWISIAVGVVFVTAIGAYAAIAGRASRSASTATAPPERTSTMAELAATPLAATPDDIAKLHGVTAREDFAEVKLADGPFEKAYLYWEKGGDHVTQIGLNARNPEDDLAALVERAREQLGHRLREAPTGGYQFSAMGAWLGISDSGNININANPEDPRWRERLAVMWTVVKGAALGTTDRIDDRARRDLLNIGYKLAELAEIDLEAVVDDAAAAVRRVAAGAEDRGEQQVIGLAHPWLERAALRWDNKPQAKLGFVTLYPRQGLALTKHADAIATCLRPALGEPERRVADHLAGKFTLDYQPRGGHPSVHVSDGTIQIGVQAWHGDKVTIAGTRAVIAALAGCGS